MWKQHFDDHLSDLEYDVMEDQGKDAFKSDGISSLLFDIIQQGVIS